MNPSTSQKSSNKKIDELNKANMKSKVLYIQPTGKNITWSLSTKLPATILKRSKENPSEKILLLLNPKLAGTKQNIINFLREAGINQLDYVANNGTVQSIPIEQLESLAYDLTEPTHVQALKAALSSVSTEKKARVKQTFSSTYDFITYNDIIDQLKQHGKPLTTKAGKESKPKELGELETELTAVLDKALNPSIPSSEKHALSVTDYNPATNRGTRKVKYSEQNRELLYPVVNNIRIPIAFKPEGLENFEAFVSKVVTQTKYREWSDALINSARSLVSFNSQMKKANTISLPNRSPSQPSVSPTFIPYQQKPESRAVSPAQSFTIPSSRTFVPQSQGFVPQSQGFVPQSQGFVPQSQGFTTFTTSPTISPTPKLPFTPERRSQSYPIGTPTQGTPPFQRRNSSPTSGAMSPTIFVKKD